MNNRGGLLFFAGSQFFLLLSSTHPPARLHSLMGRMETSPSRFLIELKVCACVDTAVTSDGNTAWRGATIVRTDSDPEHDGFWFKNYAF